jgi:hypothetical protein
VRAETVRGFSGSAAACWWRRRLKAVRKVGEVTQRLRKEGVLAKAHRPKRSVTSGDSFEEVSSVMTLTDLGINRNIVAAGVTLQDAIATDDASSCRCLARTEPGAR